MPSLLAPGSALLVGQSTIPDSGATYPSGMLYPNNSFPAGVSSNFWKDPGDWERAQAASANLHYEEFVRPLKNLQGGHTRAPGSWLSLHSTNPEAGTIAWQESNGSLVVFTGDYWREIATRILPLNVFISDVSYIGSKDVVGYDESTPSDSFVVGVSTLDGPHFVN